MAEHDEMVQTSKVRGDDLIIEKPIKLVLTKFEKRKDRVFYG